MSPFYSTLRLLQTPYMRQGDWWRRYVEKQINTEQARRAAGVHYSDVIIIAALHRIHAVRCVHCCVYEATKELDNVEMEDDVFYIDMLLVSLSLYVSVC